MIMVEKEMAEAVREAYVDGGEDLAIVELRRYFATIDDDAARQCVRTVASWPPFSPGRYARQYRFPPGSK
jgi:hypothetical protein